MNPCKRQTHDLCFNVIIFQLDKIDDIVFTNKKSTSRKKNKMKMLFYLTKHAGIAYLGLLFFVFSIVLSWTLRWMLLHSLLRFLWSIHLALHVALSVMIIAII
mmetsp:Transcript_3679/g.7052  ORF Transcript_3679/g.7052 Transcript_3679/m.7052 type:complete len:103 (+) Transcript_3679:2234-2542(+)